MQDIYHENFTYNYRYANHIIQNSPIKTSQLDPKEQGLIMEFHISNLVPKAGE
jgi:hypothetical protein